MATRCELGVFRPNQRRLACGLLLAFALTLAACAKPTPYQPVTDGHGYSELPLEGDRYRVTFSGNNQTPRETVENYLLYRAAEVTLEQGHDYFIVVERDTERSTTYYTTVTPIGGPFGYYGRYRQFYGRGGFATARSRPRDSYAAFANILIRKGEKPNDLPEAYDARDVVALLGPSILIKSEH